MQTALRSYRGVAAVRADANPADLVGKIQSAFAEFREANDKRLAEIEKKGAADVVTAEKVDRMNAAIGDLTAAQAAMAEQVARATLAGSSPRRVHDTEYTGAFLAHMKTGNVNASLNKGTAAEGGYLTPVEWDRTITDKLVEVSAMRQIATVQRISGADFSKLYNLRGTASGWVGETAARTETAGPTLGTMNFASGEMYANPSITQRLLDDAEVDVEQWLAGEIETEFAYQEGVAFVSGNGTNKPNGLLTYVTGAANAAANPLGAIALRNSAHATLITADSLVDLVHDLKSVYTANARFIMNRTTMGAIRKLKDSQNNYLWQPAYAAGQPATLLAFPVTEMAAMPDVAASAKPVAFGDFKRGYHVIDRAGVRVLRDPYTNKPYVMFYTTKRVGGGVNDPLAIKVLNISA